MQNQFTPLGSKESGSRRRERTVDRAMEVKRQGWDKAQGGSLSFGSNSTQEQKETTKLPLQLHSGQL